MKPIPLHSYSLPKTPRLPAELYRTQGVAFHLTVSAYRGKPFLGNPALCASVIQLLSEFRQRHSCVVGPYCLMPDHLHVVTAVSADSGDVRTFCDRFKGSTTHESWQHGWSGRLWQSRSYDQLIENRSSYEAVGEYIFNNPVRAGFVEDQGQWRWSGVMDPDWWAGA